MGGPKGLRMGLGPSDAVLPAVALLVSPGPAGIREGGPPRSLGWGEAKRPPKNPEGRSRRVLLAFPSHPRPAGPFAFPASTEGGPGPWDHGEGRIRREGSARLRGPAQMWLRSCHGEPPKSRGRARS